MLFRSCSDYYGEYSVKPVTNPFGTATGSARVRRGGSWFLNYGIYVRGAWRGYFNQGSYSSDTGFRCVMATPVITSFLPTSGIAGTIVAVNGNNLSGANVVTFNGVPATIMDVTPTAMRVVVPTGASLGKISVTTPVGTATSSEDFTFIYGTKVNPKDNAALLWVPGGTFTMGSPVGVGTSTAEQPSHQVSVSGYWIYKYEVTVEQYRAFCIDTSRTLPSFPPGYSWSTKSGWDDLTLQQHPIVNVTWDDCKAYAEWAGVTLLTEAQWEFAARGVKGNNYPWGGTASAVD